MSSGRVTPDVRQQYRVDQPHRPLRRAHRRRRSGRGRRPAGRRRPSGPATVRSLLTGQDAIQALYAATTRIHPDGTPGTKHVTTNLILDIDDEAGTASARSYWTVLQAVPGLPLQPILAGRYHDRFERAEGTGASPSGGTWSTWSAT